MNKYLLYWRKKQNKYSLNRILAKKKKSILEYVQVLGEINLSESISVYLGTHFQDEKFEKT